MESWLATHALEVIFAVIVTASSGSVGLTKRLRRQARELRAENGRLRRELSRTRNEHSLSLEFNMKDRLTIQDLAEMVHDYRKQLNLPELNLLVHLNAKAEARFNTRRLSAGVHITSSQQPEDYLSDE